MHALQANFVSLEPQREEIQPWVPSGGYFSYYFQQQTIVSFMQTTFLVKSLCGAPPLSFNNQDMHFIIVINTWIIHEQTADHNLNVGKFLIVYLKFHEIMLILQNTQYYIDIQILVRTQYCGGQSPFSLYKLNSAPMDCGYNLICHR